MAFADTQKLIVEIDLKGNLKSGLADATRTLRGFDRATSNTQRSLGKFGRNIEKSAVVLAGLATTGFLAVTKAASDYESAFAGVRKTVDASEAQLNHLSDQFRQLAKEIPISAAELARLGEAGGALGIPIENMEEFVRVTALLGVTTDLTADDAATSLGVLSNVLGLTADEYSKFASSLVALGNAGASTESQIIEIAQRAGASGELVGFASDQVLGFASAVASLGIEAEAGGTAIQKFFIESAKQVAAGGDELELFAKVSGKSTKTFRTNFEKNAGAALTDFLQGLGKLDAAAQFNVLDELGFGDSRITRTLLGLANNTKLLTDQLKVAHDAFDANNALTKEAEQRFKTFDSQLQVTKNILTDVAITVGSKLLPKLTPLLKRLNEFITGHQGDIEKFGTQFAEGFEKFADAIGKTDWTPFIDGLKLSATLAKGAFDTFNALPDWFKGIVIAGFAVNKFTGGLITSLGKDLASALGDQFLSRGSNPRNPLWVQMAGAPLGGGVGAGGGSGKLGAAANLITKVAIVGIAADVANTLKPAVVGAGISIHDALGLPTITPDDLPWPFGPKNTPTILPEIFGGNGILGGTGAQGTPTNTVRIPENPRLIAKMGDLATRQNITNERLESIKGYTAAQSIAQSNLLRSSERNEAVNRAGHAAAQAAAFATRDRLGAQLSGLSAIENAAKTSLTNAINATRAAAAHAGQQAAAAIRDKDLSVTTNVRVNTSVSVRENITKQTTYKKYYTVAS